MTDNLVIIAGRHVGCLATAQRRQKIGVPLVVYEAAAR